MAERLVTPMIQGRGVRGLTREAFTVAPQKPRIIGDYGRRAAPDPVRYLMPAAFDPAALLSMSPEELTRLEQQASEQYDRLEQSWQSVVPDGYTGIYATEDGPLSGPDPMALPENQDRARALELLGQIQGNVRTVRGQLEQDRLRGENQLFGGAVEAGYEFAQGALNDANVRAAIWENRNNPKYFESAAARNFSRNTADPTSRHASEQRAFTVADLAKMGVGLPGYGQQGQQTTIVRPGGVTEQPGDNVAPRYATPDETMAPEDVVTRTPMLRPDPAMVGAPPRSTLSRAPRIRSAPTIVGRSGVM